MQTERNETLRFSWTKYAFIIATLLLGCDAFDDEKEVIPVFNYQCVDAEADYACIDADYYEYTIDFRNGYVLNDVALGSHFNIEYGRDFYSYYTDDDYDYSDYQYSYGEARVVSASNERVESGTAFTALETGLTALIALNDDDEVVDYMYVNVEPVTSIRLFSDGASSADTIDSLSLYEGETARLRATMMSGAAYLCGTPSFECRMTESPGAQPQAQVLVDCSSPGAINITAESAGASLVIVETGGAQTEIEVRVVEDVRDTATDTETETDMDTDTDSDNENGDTDIDAGTDTETDTGTNTDSDSASPSDAGVDTETNSAEDTEEEERSTSDNDGGIDASADTDVEKDTSTEWRVDTETQADGGADGGMDGGVDGGVDHV